MGLYRRSESSNPKVWYMRYTDANGKLIRASTETESKQLAELVLAKVKAEAWECKRFGTKPAVKLSDACEVFLRSRDDKKVHDDYERQLAWWQSKLPSGISLHEIGSDKIASLLEQKRAEKNRSGKHISRSTCNRYLSAIRALLNYYKDDLKQIDKVPEFSQYKEPKGRTRYLKPEEIGRLLDALPAHLVAPTVVALSTGLRRSRCMGLRWDQVDMDRRVVLIDGDEMKNGEDHGIPLSDIAFEAISEQRGKHERFVFTYNGRGFKRPGTATWNNALAEAKIEDFRWHDLRHTWASMMTQAGVSDAVLQRLGGWKTAGMVRRYAHHAVDALRPHAQLVDRALGQVTHFKHTPPSAPNVLPLRKIA